MQHVAGVASQQATTELKAELAVGAAEKPVDRFIARAPWSAAGVLESLNEHGPRQSLKRTIERHRFIGRCLDDLHDEPCQNLDFLHSHLDSSSSI